MSRVNVNLTTKIHCTEFQAPEPREGETGLEYFIRTCKDFEHWMNNALTIEVSQETDIITESLS